jgi:hypothetical protein
MNVDQFDGTTTTYQGVNTVKVYVIDDINNNFKLENKGYKKIDTYNKVITTNQTYKNILYSIQLIAEKDSQELNRLHSYVKK